MRRYYFVLEAAKASERAQLVHGLVEGHLEHAAELMSNKEDEATFRDTVYFGLQYRLRRRTVLNLEPPDNKEKDRFAKIPETLKQEIKGLYKHVWKEIGLHAASLLKESSIDPDDHEIARDEYIEQLARAVVMTIHEHTTVWFPIILGVTAGAAVGVAIVPVVEALIEWWRLHHQKENHD